MKIDSNLVAVVVGGASGMGAGTVEALRAQGAQVAILDLNAELGNAVAQRTGAVFFPINVLEEASVVEAFTAARKHQGQERVMVCTPGGGGLGKIAWRENGVIRRYDFARFEQIIKLNLNGTFLCASVAAEGMLGLEPDENGERGTIVMTSSIASTDAPGATGAYVAAKSGINGLTLSIARDLAPEGIRVNTILPGSFETPRLSNVPDSYKADMRSWNLFPKRFGVPEEYASMALELIRNGYMNGAQIRLDAGARA
jgi:NAD(P)-dependent dehydrogenase (short-subunit alcohol dehydrogenase family)